MTNATCLNFFIFQTFRLCVIRCWFWCWFRMNGNTFRKLSITHCKNHNFIRSGSVFKSIQWHLLWIWYGSIHLRLVKFDKVKCLYQRICSSENNCFIEPYSLFMILSHSVGAMKSMPKRYSISWKHRKDILVNITGYAILCM